MVSQDREIAEAEVEFFSFALRTVPRKRAFISWVSMIISCLLALAVTW